MILLYPLLAIGALIIVWQVIKRPFFGLLLMLFVNPLEALFKLPTGLTAGRIVAAMAFLGWFVHLQRNSEARGRLRNSKLIRIVWTFPLVCIVGVMLSETTAGSIECYSAAITVILLSLLALMIENLVDSKKKINQLMLVVALSCTVTAIFPLAYFFNIDLYAPLTINAAETFSGGRASGLTNNPNALGISASMGLFALIVLSSVERRKLATLTFLAMALVMIGSLVLSGSRTHFVVFFVCILVFGGLRFLGPRKGRLPSLITALALLAMVPFAYQRAPENLQERFIVVGIGVRSDTLDRADFTRNQRLQAVDTLLDHPLLGLGLQGFQVREKNVGVHDTFSAVVGETGLLGVLTISLLVFTCWRWLYYGIRNGKKCNLFLYYYSAGFMASFVSMLVASIGGYILFYERWFWITVGISAVIARWTSAVYPPRYSPKDQGGMRGVSGLGSRHAPAGRILQQSKASLLNRKL